MIPDRLQYLLDDFWIDQKGEQIWTLGARIHYQNTSKNTIKYGIIFENIIFVNDRIVNFVCFEKMKLPCTIFVSCVRLKS